MLKTFTDKVNVLNSFTILQINSRSLIKNFDKIENLLITLKLSPDIIAISETKLKNDIPFPYTLQNYNFLFNNSPTNAGGSGIFIKSSYIHKQINHFNLNLNACEDLWIEITLTNKQTLIVGTIYRHPNYNIKSFLNSMESTVDKLQRKNLNYFLCGDINIDLLKQNNNEINNYKNTLLSYGCKQYVKNATHLVNNTPVSLLDHFYSNYETGNINSHILLDDISDHLPVLTTIEKVEILKNYSTLYMHDTRNFNAEEFLIDLNESLHLNISLQNDNVHDLFQSFNDTFIFVLNNHAPMRKLTRKQKQIKNKPWITKGILISIKNKNKLLHKMIKSQTQQHKNEYQTYRNKLTHIIQLAKKTLY